MCIMQCDGSRQCNFRDKNSQEKSVVNIIVSSRQAVSIVIKVMIITVVIIQNKLAVKPMLNTLSVVMLITTWNWVENLFMSVKLIRSHFDPWTVGTHTIMLVAVYRYDRCDIGLDNWSTDQRCGCGLCRESCSSRSCHLTAFACSSSGSRWHRCLTCLSQIGSKMISCKVSSYAVGNVVTSRCFGC